jgi:2-methylcitrate dehydratase PrpD
MGDAAMDSAGLTCRVAAYALELKPGAIRHEVRDRARALFLDFLGLALGASRLWPRAEALRSGVAALAGGASGLATVAGRNERWLPQHAALLNGAFAHAMDFDDTHREAVMHVGTPLFAALLAAAETRDTSGADFLTAAVVGYELSSKLGLAHLDLVHLRGFHPTATTGIFAATAAAGRLLGLSQQAIEAGLGLDLSLASGTQQFADGGGANKPLQVGWAAHNALASLTLAEAGLPGTRHALEGRLGYYATYAEPGSDLDRVVLDLEHPGELLRVGIKPYPCCRWNHGTIDGITEIVRRERLDADEVESIEIALPPAAFRVVGAGPEIKRRPASVVDAQFSDYFAAAVAASGEAFSWDSYDRIHDPGLQRIMDRVTVAPADDLIDVRTRLTVRSRRGVWSMELPYPKGEPEAPMGWSEVAAKYLLLAEKAIDAGRARELAARVRELDSVDRIADLAALLRPKEA